MSLRELSDRPPSTDAPIGHFLDLISRNCGGPAPINNPHWFGIHLAVNRTREDVIAVEATRQEEEIH